MHDASIRVAARTHIEARTELRFRASTDAGFGDPRNAGAIRATVLIVDDHASFRAWAAAVLRSEGYDVVGEAHDADSALERARALRPDIVLLDVQLPGLDGFEIARRLRASDAAVVLISTRDRLDYGPAVSDCGARGFVAKDDLCGPALEALLA